MRTYFFAITGALGSQSWASQVALVVRNLPANAGDIETWVWFLGSGRSSGEGNGNPFQYFCLRTPWTEEPGRLQSMGLQRVGHKWSGLADTDLKVGLWWANESEGVQGWDQGHCSCELQCYVWVQSDIHAPNRNQLCPTVRTEWRVHTEGITDPFFLQNPVIARGCFKHRLAQISRWSTTIQLIAYINLHTATLRVLSSETVSAES